MGKPSQNSARQAGPLGWGVLGQSVGKGLSPAWWELRATSASAASSLSSASAGPWSPENVSSYSLQPMTSPLLCGVPGGQGQGDGQGFLPRSSRQLWLVLSGGPAG